MKVLFKSLARFYKSYQSGTKGLAPLHLKSVAGFTAIELLIVITILAIVSIILVPGFIGYYGRLNVTSEAEQLVSVLREAQGRALAHLDGSSWGVHIVNLAAGQDYFELFSGSSYLGLASSTYYLSVDVEFLNPAVGTNKDVVFSNSGQLSSSADSVVLQHVDSVNNSRTINVNADGSISY